MLRDPRQERTRAALYRTLLKLLEKKPFDQVTVREITRRARIGYATFFRHYPDKGSLLHDLAERQIAELLALTLPVLSTDDSSATTRKLCEYVWEHRKLWFALLSGGASDVLQKEFVRQARRVAAEHDAHADRTWLPNDLRVVFCVTGVLEILAWWLQQKPPPPVERMAEILDRLVVAPSVRVA